MTEAHRINRCALLGVALNISKPIEIEVSYLDLNWERTHYLVRLGTYHGQGGTVSEALETLEWALVHGLECLMERTAEVKKRLGIEE